MTEELPAVPGETVITTPQEALAALVNAFVDGDPETSQHIVDTLGTRARPKPSGAALDWAP